MFIYIVFALVTFLIFIKYRQAYWKRRGLFQLEPEFFFGNARRELLGKRSIFLLFRDVYERTKAMKQKHVGIYFFLGPVYVPVDLAIIKQILIKDFSYFRGHGGFTHSNDRLSMNLFSMEGDPWKQLRVKLTPTFTSGKMKMMFDTLVTKTEGLEKLVNTYVVQKTPIDIKEVVARFTTDIIASCAFGIENNALEDDNNEFREIGRKTFKPDALRVFLPTVIPSWILGPLGFKVAARDVEEFFSNTVLNTIKYREESKIFRKDFMHLLLQLKHANGNESNHTQALTNDELIGQSFIFFLAGFETSSTTMTFALLELSQQEDIQDKLRNEIVEVLERHDGNVTYEAVMEMQYLEMVINETLRKYPPLASLPRVCSKTYKVPGTDVTIEKGTQVQVPVWGIHMDPEYYPNPEYFNPENFSPENKANRPDMTFFPFGDGPRMCIGLRFGMLQTKIGLVSLLRNFRFSINDKTHIPIQIEKIGFVLSVEGDVWLNVSKV